MNPRFRLFRLCRADGGIVQRYGRGAIRVQAAATRLVVIAACEDVVEAREVNGASASEVESGGRSQRLEQACLEVRAEAG